MIFVILTLLVAAAAAYLGYLKGFRKMWPVTFNTLASLYIAIALTRTFGAFMPALAKSQSIKASLIIAIAAVSYIILYLIAMWLASSEFIRSIPQLAEDIGGAILGFVTGFAICSMMFFVLFIFVCRAKPTADFTHKYFGRQASNSVKNQSKFFAAIALQDQKDISSITETIQWLTTGIIDKEPVDDSGETQDSESQS